MRKLAFILFLLTTSSFLQAQKNSLDSLKKALLVASDSAKTALYNDLALKLRNTDARLAMMYADSALSQAQKMVDGKGEATALMHQGSISYYMSDYLKALELTRQALAIFKELKDSTNIARTLTNIGNYYNSLGNYTIALQHFFDALTVSEQNSDATNMAYSLASAGGVYRAQANYDEALQYYKRASDIYSDAGDDAGVAMTSNSIGATYLALKNYQEAFEYFFEALALRQKLKDQLGIAYTLNQLATAHRESGRPQTALSYALQALDLYEQYGTKAGMALTMNEISKLYFDIGNHRLAREYALQALQASANIGAKEHAKNAAQNVALAAAALNDFMTAYKYQKIFSQYADSLVNEQNTKERANLRINYELDKRQTEIDLLTEQNNMQQTINYALAIFVGIVLILIVLLAYAFIQKQKTNEQLIEQNHQINSHREEIEQQNQILKEQSEEIQIQAENLMEANRLIIEKNAEAEAQKQELEIQTENVREINNLILEKNELLKHQKGIIEIKNKNITDSIRYAGFIQQAILTPIDVLQEWFPNNFIYYKPRDIVSGDFYWFRKIQQPHRELLITVVADCTGHGVPGALMSMLGITLLNEISSKNKQNQNLTADFVLNELRRLIKGVLHQTGKLGEAQDGMDITLCIFEHGTNRLQFAGAYNPLVIVRNQQIIELKADRMPIGVYKRDFVPFTNHEINLYNGDVLYMFSDGYMDQLGGMEGKKIMFNRFKQLLIDVSMTPLHEQEIILETNLLAWQAPQGNRIEAYEQVDDILVMGIHWQWV